MNAQFKTPKLQENMKMQLQQYKQVLK
jgi:hypothetical protein